jgi:hypothetical protein
VVQVGLGQQRVLADDVHRPGPAREAALDHLGDDAPHAAGRSDAPGRLELGQRVVDIMLIAGQVRRNAPRVATALHVVLAAQRRDAAAGASHLSRHEGEIQERVRVVDAVDVLGDPHAPDEAGATKRRPGIPPRRARDVGGGHAGNTLGIVERVRLQ